MSMDVLEEMKPCAQDVETLEAGLRRMLGLANDLCEGIRAGCDHDFMERQIRLLIDFMERHFACEEDLLERMHYAALAAHRHEHQNLLEWLKQMRVRMEAGTLPTSELEIAGYLRDWLGEHMRRSDQSYLSEMGSHESW